MLYTVCPSSTNFGFFFFFAACGAVCCRDLKGGEPRVDCRVCVRTAADLLERLQGAS